MFKKIIALFLALLFVFSSLVACTENEIFDSLNKLYQNPELLLDYAQKACLLGVVNHSKEKIQQVFDSVIKEASEK